MTHHSKLVAIVNVTPDSFSDGGLHIDSRSALRAIRSFIDEGVEVIDMGAESTRPGAKPLSPEEEWQRLENILPQALEHFRGEVLFSVDTRNAQTARKALALGVDWINDVAGFRDDAMVQAVAESRCKLVLTHSLTVPTDPAVTLPGHADPVEELLQFAEEAKVRLAAHGIAHERLIFDPGIGFGKTAEQSLAILRRIAELRKAGMPLFIGHSRKSFLHLFTKAPVSERDDATLAVSSFLMMKGVDYLRVHDVPRHALLRSILREMEG